MNQHVLHVFKVLDVDQALHRRVLVETILDDLDRPIVFSDHNQTFDLQGVLRDLLILTLNAFLLCIFNIVEDGTVLVSNYIVRESISDNFQSSFKSLELYDASMMCHSGLG